MPTLTLELAEKLAYQFVYRQERSRPFQPHERADVDFVWLSHPSAVLRHLFLLRPLLGWSGCLKAVSKLATGRRFFYLVHQEGRPASTGWCTVGQCRYYLVEADAVVIGPIWSDQSFRGQGLATFALQRAINLLLREGRNTFYIDTSQTNYSCQRVIDKCDFGPPLAVYVRSA